MQKEMKPPDVEEISQLEAYPATWWPLPLRCSLATSCRQHIQPLTAYGRPFHRPSSPGGYLSKRANNLLANSDGFRPYHGHNNFGVAVLGGQAVRIGHLKLSLTRSPF